MCDSAKLDSDQRGIFANGNTASISNIPLRVGIVLTEVGRLNTSALQYLILHLNTLQKHVEFEFPPTDLRDSLLSQLTPRSVISWEQCQIQMKTFVRRYIDFLQEQNSEYRLSEVPPSYFIIISLAKLSTNWYSIATKDLSILFLGDWKRYMAPPSLMEFIMTLVILETALALSPRIDRSRSHLGTKGCIGDFNAQLTDVRFKTLQSFICSYCMDLFRENGVEEEVQGLVNLLNKDWIGSTQNPSSPAGIVAKLGYDLFLTKGVAPTQWETLKGILQQEGTKEFIKLISAVVLAAVLLWLGLKK